MSQGWIIGLDVGDKWKLFAVAESNQGKAAETVRRELSLTSTGPVETAGPISLDKYGLELEPGQVCEMQSVAPLQRAR